MNDTAPTPADDDSDCDCDEKFNPDDVKPDRPARIRDILITLAGEMHEDLERTPAERFADMPDSEPTEQQRLDATAYRLLGEIIKAGAMLSMALATGDETREHMPEHQKVFVEQAIRTLRGSALLRHMIYDCPGEHRCEHAGPVTPEASGGTSTA